MFRTVTSILVCRVNILGTIDSQPSTSSHLDGNPKQTMRKGRMACLLEGRPGIKVIKKISETSTKE